MKTIYFCIKKTYKQQAYPLERLLFDKKLPTYLVANLTTCLQPKNRLQLDIILSALYFLRAQCFSSALVIERFVYAHVNYTKLDKEK